MQNDVRFKWNCNFFICKQYMLYLNLLLNVRSLLLKIQPQRVYIFEVFMIQEIFLRMSKFYMHLIPCKQMYKKVCFTNTKIQFTLSCLLKTYVRWGNLFGLYLYNG